MAVTVTSVNAGVTTSGRNEDSWGARRVGLYRVTLDNSYLAGGVAFDPRLFGFDKPVAAVFSDVRKVAATVGKSFMYDYVNKKVVATVDSTGVEVANAVDLSTVVIDVIVVSE